MIEYNILADNENHIFTIILLIGKFYQTSTNHN